MPADSQLAAFYEHVGSVDLTEGDAAVGKDAPFEKLGEDDPLVVVPIQPAAAELAAIAARNRGLPKLLHEPLAVYIAPGRAAKADQEADDTPIAMVLPQPAADGLLTVHDVSFVGYLRRAIARGGFFALQP